MPEEQDPFVERSRAEAMLRQECRDSSSIFYIEDESKRAEREAELRARYDAANALCNEENERKYSYLALQGKEAK